VKNFSIMPELLRIHAEAAGSRKQKLSERGWPHGRI
jgi:hypothetical protein